MRSETEIFNSVCGHDDILLTSPCQQAGGVEGLLDDMLSPFKRTERNVTPSAFVRVKHCGTFCIFT